MQKALTVPAQRSGFLSGHRSLSEPDSFWLLSADRAGSRRSVGAHALSALVLLGLAGNLGGEKLGSSGPRGLAEAYGCRNPHMTSDYDDLSAPVSLTPYERQTLLLQHQILAHLDEGEADYHSRMVKVLTEGFTGEYEALFVAYAELPKADCTLMMDILDMFKMIKASLAALEEPERASLLSDHEYVLRYQGLDYNDAREGKLASYVSYLQSTDRWTELRDDVEAADGGNSHAPMLTRYQGTLRVYQPIWNEVVQNHRGPRSFLLSAEQLRRVGRSQD